VKILGRFDIFKHFYKLCLGDFDAFTTDFSDTTTGSGLFLWLVFLVATMSTMIIMLNLLISFLGDSYN